MGRPPLGHAAMSSAERVRRWRERHGKTTRNETGNGNETRNEKPSNENGNETLVVELQARVAELEVALAQPDHVVVRDLFARLKEHASTIKALRRDAKTQARAEVDAEVDALKAKIARFEAEPDAAYADRIKSLEAQLKAARTQAGSARAGERKLRESSALALTKAESRILRKALHPDTANNEEALTKAAQLLNGLIDSRRLLIDGE